MHIGLGVDFGTCFSSVTLRTVDGLRPVSTEPGGADRYPSSACVSAGGELVTGDAAEREQLRNPNGYLSQFKFQLSSHQLRLGGCRLSRVDLVAAVIRELSARAEHLAGCRVEDAVMAHPPAFLEHKLSLLRQACRLAGLKHVTLVPEPVAAARGYVATHDDQPRLHDGDVALVYDLGGGGLSAALVLKRGAGFEVLDQVRHPDAGGPAFDRCVYEHVCGKVMESARVVGPLLHPDRGDDEGYRAQVRLLRACRRLKEHLSENEVGELDPAALDEDGHGFELSRVELERLIRPKLVETIQSCRALLDRAALAPGALAATLLVGGSTRIPLVHELVAAEIGVPLLTMDDPELAVSLGAAAFVRSGGETTSPREVVRYGTLSVRGSATAAAAFSPGGGALVTGPHGRTLSVGSFPGGDVLRTIDVDESWLASLACSGDGKLIAVAGARQEISLWDASSGRHVRRLGGHQARVSAVTFTGDSRFLISASDDGTVRQWDLARHGQERIWRTDGEPHGCAVGGGGRWVATAIGDRIRAWSLSSGEEEFCLPTPHTAIADLAIDRSGTVLAAAGLDGNVSLWNRHSKTPLALIEAHSGPARCVRFGGNVLVTGGADTSIRLWAVETGALLNTLSRHTGPIRFLALDATGRRMASGAVNGVVELWGIQ